MPLSEILKSDELYLSLVIGQKKVKSGIWQLKDSESKVLSYGTTENWSGESAEELLVVADSSIASAVSKLSEVSACQPTKTILGLPENWVEANSVRREKLKVIQNACKKLLLKPLGFVVIPEAIAHLLKKQEGGLPSVILVTLEESEIIVSLIIEGKFLGSKIVGRSDNLALDLEEGLLRFDYQGALPPRILLGDGESLPEAKQNLIAYPWVTPEEEKKIKFLQLPKVEILPENFEVSAVVLAGSYELGRAEEKTEELKPEENVVPEEDFGFIKNEDILKANPELVESLRQPEIQVPQAPVESNPLKIKHLPNPFSIFRLFLPKKKFVILPLFLVLLFGAGFLGILSIIKAEVILSVQPQKIQKEFEFTISSKETSINEEKMILPVKEITVEVTGEKTAGVAGKKTVGEKATGEVVVYNRTDRLIILPKDSVLRSSAGLNFLLTQEVKIASKTADLEKGVDRWGEAKAPVAAEKIGSQYNLEAGSIFSFEKSPPSVLLVKNLTGFSHGTSREIQAVSREDREAVQKTLQEELLGKAQEQIKSKISSADQIITGSLLLKSRTDRFNHEVGDEASLISLEEKASFSALYLREEDFSTLIERLTLPLVSEGFEKKPAKKLSFFEVKDEKKKIFLAKISQEHYPAIPTEEIKKQLRVKTTAYGEKYLMSLNNIVHLEIIISPQIFSGLKILPLREKNINVLVKAVQS